jgi:ribosomal protein S30
MEHQFFIRQQNLKLYRNLVAASEAAAAKADARQEKLLKLLAEEVANEPPPRLRDIDSWRRRCYRASSSRDPLI